MLPGSTDDTAPAADAMQVALLRRAGSAARFARARSLTRSTVELARRAIRRQNPAMSEREVALRFVELCYGSELAEAVRDHLDRRTP